MLLGSPGREIHKAESGTPISNQTRKQVVLAVFCWKEMVAVFIMAHPTALERKFVSSGAKSTPLQVYLAARKLDGILQRSRVNVTGRGRCRLQQNQGVHEPHSLKKHIYGQPDSGSHGVDAY